MGSFISLSKGLKNVLVCALKDDYKHLLDIAMNFALKNSNTMVHCVINLSGNNKIEDLAEINKAIPNNLKVILYPSNRIIEKHLLVMQFLLKNQKIKNCGLLYNDTTINLKEIASMDGLKAYDFDGKKMILLKTKTIIKKYLIGQNINQLKTFFS